MKEEVTTKQYHQNLYKNLMQQVCGNKYYLQCRKYKKHKTRYNNHIDWFILKKKTFQIQIQITMFQIRIKFIQKQSFSDQTYSSKTNDTSIEVLFSFIYMVHFHCFTPQNERNLQFVIHTQLIQHYSNINYETDI